MVTNTQGAKFNIIVAGGGLGGLGAAIGLAQSGHSVTVLEGSSKLGEVGAGIQIPPNSVRVLDAYGVLPELEKVVTKPACIRLRRYKSGEVLDETPLQTRMLENYGYPYWLVHRAQYQQVLYDAAIKAGAKVLFNARAQRVDDETQTLYTTDGRTFTGDLIIGADGIRSAVRATAVITDDEIAPLLSGNAAYRATIPKEQMLNDPKVAHLMSDVAANCWIGYRRHVMAYPIKNGELYNLVMSHPAQGTVGVWSEPGDIQVMHKHFDKWDPTLKRVLDKVDSTLEWVLAYLPKLTTWISKSGHVILIGDAAHATLPYLAQGAAMAIEDGATLVSVLDKCQNSDEIPVAVAEYQKRRKRRCERVVAGSNANGDIWHMPDGEEQEERDLKMKLAQKGSPLPKGDSNPNQWSDANFQPWLFGWNAFTD